MLRQQIGNEPVTALQQAQPQNHPLLPSHGLNATQSIHPGVHWPSHDECLSCALLALRAPSSYDLQWPANTEMHTEVPGGFSKPTPHSGETLLFRPLLSSTKVTDVGHAMPSVR